MHQTFTTLYGQAVVERKTLYIKTFDISFWRSPLVRFIGELLFIVTCILVITGTFFTAGESFKNYVQAVMWAMLLFTRFDRWYSVLFRQSFAIRIPIHRIRSVHFSETASGLNTEMHLRLANGRIRTIVFRTSEKEHISLADFLSLHISSLQVA